jgi:hypothetical protein
MPAGKLSQDEPRELAVSEGLQIHVNRFQGVPLLYDLRKSKIGMETLMQGFAQNAEQQTPEWDLDPDDLIPLLVTQGLYERVCRTVLFCPEPT